MDGIFLSWLIYIFFNVPPLVWLKKASKNKTFHFTIFIHSETTKKLFYHLRIFILFWLARLFARIILKICINNGETFKGIISMLAIQYFLSLYWEMGDELFKWERFEWFSSPWFCKLSYSTIFITILHSISYLFN